MREHSTEQECEKHASTSESEPFRGGAHVWRPYCSSRRIRKKNVTSAAQAEGFAGQDCLSTALARDDHMDAIDVGFERGLVD
jgi:hypothetical protein